MADTPESFIQLRRIIPLSPRESFESVPSHRPTLEYRRAGEKLEQVARG
jgi:hypothetical protein